MCARIITFTGPSGVGKSTLRRILSDMQSDAFTSLAMMTARQPKPGDDGEYQYVSLEGFLQMRDAGIFAAHTRVPGVEERWYAYRMDTIDDALMQDRSPLLITDHLLLSQLRDRFGPDRVYSIGLLPPGDSMEAMLAVLHERLRSRGRETDSDINDRLLNAREDIEYLRSGSQDHIVINDVLRDTIDLLLRQLTV